MAIISSWGKAAPRSSTRSGSTIRYGGSSFGGRTSSRSSNPIGLPTNASFSSGFQASASSFPTLSAGAPKPPGMGLGLQGTMGRSNLAPVSVDTSRSVGQMTGVRPSSTNSAPIAHFPNLQGAIGQLRRRKAQAEGAVAGNYFGGM